MNDINTKDDKDKNQENYDVVNNQSGLSNSINFEMIGEQTIEEEDLNNKNKNKDESEENDEKKK